MAIDREPMMRQVVEAIGETSAPIRGSQPSAQSELERELWGSLANDAKALVTSSGVWHRPADRDDGRRCSGSITARVDLTPVRKS